jgi:hypothetical protein
VVKLLADRGTALEAKDDCRQTPLTWVAQDGHETIIKLLFGIGKIEADSKDERREKPTVCGC